MELPEIMEVLLEDCLNAVPIEADRDYIKTFILNGQAAAKELIYSEYYDEDEEPTNGLTL